jgi:hypothetical protein
MHVFTFLSQSRCDLAGFTTQRAGANLPGETGPWVPVNQGALHEDDLIAGLYGGGDTVLEGIERDGFYLGRVEVRRSPVR